MYRRVGLSVLDDREERWMEKRFEVDGSEAERKEGREGVWRLGAGRNTGKSGRVSG